ncbi:hypothetical protein [Kitasatospora viridis]|uniref:Uncharacterized protein n=1 Tax=Kitasatospora viridis TaxID=281105 RepID=A0A561T7K7_9ACTN|nr:hypothetical protein [Kitasatospora viridis]TWF83080.1 hypothetical protein FHX73_14563 [Kitasatospora viridis]
MDRRHDGGTHGPGRAGSTGCQAVAPVPVPWLCRWQSADRADHPAGVTRTADNTARRHAPEGYRYCVYPRPGQQVWEN